MVLETNLSLGVFFAKCLVALFGHVFGHVFGRLILPWRGGQNSTNFSLGVFLGMSLGVSLGVCFGHESYQFVFGRVFGILWSRHGQWQ